MTLGGRQPSLEDNLQWKTTFGGRWPLVDDDFLWKTTLGGRQRSVEDKVQWKMTFGGLGWTVPHSDFLIDTKNIETQRFFFWFKLYELFFPCMLPSPLCCLQHFCWFRNFFLGSKIVGTIFCSWLFLQWKLINPYFFRHIFCTLNIFKNFYEAFWQSNPNLFVKYSLLKETQLIFSESPSSLVQIVFAF